MDSFNWKNPIDLLALAVVAFIVGGVMTIIGLVAVKIVQAF